jgi:hypothetical protein
MKTDYAKIDQDLCAIFGPQFVDRRMDINSRARVYSFLQHTLANRTDRRYLSGMLQGLVSFGIITQIEWSGLMDRFVKREKKTPAR